MSYLTQMAGLAVAQLPLGRDRHRARDRAGARLSRAVGARPSAISGSTSSAATLYVLLPISIVVALVLVWQGVPQNLGAYTRGHHARGREADHRRRAGRLAGGDQELGTNGGGFFNANSAHPFENPTPLTNFVEMLVDLR